MRQSVDHARRRGIGIFLFFDARQKKMKIVGQHEKRPCFRAPARAFVVVQLIDGIKRLKLNPRLCVQLRKRNAAVNGSDRAFRAAVAITINAPDRLVLFVQQDVIDAPGIHPYRIGRFSQLPRLFQPVENFPEKSLCVPHQPLSALTAQRAGRPGQRFGRIGKAVDLFGNYLSALDVRQNMTARRCADIDRKIVSHDIAP